MNTWKERLLKHPIHSEISKSLDSLEGLQTKDVLQLKAIERLKRIFRHIKGVLETIDPELTPVNVIGSVSPPIQKILHSLDQFVQNPNITFLDEANNQADLILNNFRGLLDSAPRNIEVLREDLESFQIHAESLINKFQQSVDEKLKQASTLQQTVETISQRLEDNGKEIQNQKKRIDDSISQFQAQFSDAENNRRKEHSTILEEERKKFAQVFSDLEAMEKKEETGLKEGFANLLDELKTKAGNELSEMENSKEKAKNLLRIVTNIGVTGDFAKTAEQERKSADRLRIMAFLGLVILLVLVCWFVYATVGEKFSWEMLLIRIPLVIAPLLFFAYSAKESEKHRRRETRNRKLQLELASIDPFLESLPEERRVSLKEELAKRLFAQKIEVSYGKNKISSRELIGLVEQILQFLKSH